jgi:truncated hemoglobin YjbI
MNQQEESLYDKLGGIERIKQLTQNTMKKVIECGKLKPFFDSTPIELHVKRFAYYISYLTGG